MTLKLDDRGLPLPAKWRTVVMSYSNYKKPYREALSLINEGWEIVHVTDLTTTIGILLRRPRGSNGT